MQKTKFQLAKLNWIHLFSFTLIELMVVIIIIIIFITILLPALFATRARARVAVCCNNLKQTALAGFTYAQDWDEVLPHAGGIEDIDAHTWYEVSSTTWWEKLAYYVGEFQYRYRKDIHKHAVEITVPTALHCPQVLAEMPVQYRGHADYHFILKTILGGQRSNNNPPVPRMRNLKDTEFWFSETPARYNETCNFWDRPLAVAVTKIATLTGDYPFFLGFIHVSYLWIKASPRIQEPVSFWGWSCGKLALWGSILTKVTAKTSSIENYIELHKRFF